MSAVKTSSEQAAKRNIAGSAAIEFGLFIPVLAIFVMGAAELGFGIYQATQVYNSCEAGMVYASKHGWNSAGITAAVINATGMPGITATPAPTQFCGCPGAAAVTTVTCSSTCTNGNIPGQYIQINAALVRRSILSFPGLPLPSTLSATSIIRIN